jgi:acetyl esterase/lipase
MDLYVILARLAGARLPDVKIDGEDLSPVLFGEPGATGREEFWYYSGRELHAVRQGKWKLHVPHEYLSVAGEPGRGGKPSEWGRLKPLSIEISGIRGIASRHGYRVENIGLSLFDLEEDPGETRNVAAAHPDIVDRLMSRMAAARDDLGDELTGIAPHNARPAGDVRPPVPPEVERISNLEYARPATGGLLLDLYLPKERSASAPVPIVLWIHGGGWIHGSKENCPLPWLAAKGYAVASINYRLLHEAIWPAQIDDCRAAMKWLRNHAEEYCLDGRRLGTAGSSAGAHLAALLGTVDVAKSDRVQAVIDFYGPSDLLTMPANVPGSEKTDAVLARTNGARLLGGIVRDRPELARQASALHQVSAGDAPFLILQGDKDESVPPEQSQRLAARLQEAGVPVVLHVVTGAGHGGPAFQTDEMKSLILDFLNRHLKQ